MAPSAASTNHTSGPNQPTGGGFGSNDQRSMLIAIHAIQTISMSCRTTARRGWIAAIRLRGSMAPPRRRAEAPALACDPDEHAERIHARGGDKARALAHLDVRVRDRHP